VVRVGVLVASGRDFLGGDHILDSGSLGSIAAFVAWGSPPDSQVGAPGKGSALELP
jgi:hypothetical protein